MMRQSFHIGTHMLFKGREYVVSQRLSNNDLRIKDVVTNEYKAIAEVDLVEALFDGNLEFFREGTNCSFAEVQSARSYIQDLNVLNDDDPKQKRRKEETRRKYKYVSEVLARDVPTLTKEVLDPLINELATLINDPKPPCWSTLYKWVRAYVKAGEDIRVLVPETNKRGNTKPMYSGRRLRVYTEQDKEKAREVSQVIAFVVQEKYLTPARHSVLETYKFLEGYIKEINKFRKEADKLPTPHRDSLYHYISKLDKYEVDVTRMGRSYADRKHLQVMQSPRPSRPLERVEMDHTKTNLMAVDLETRLPIGRATLTDALDVNSKMPLGSYMSFEPPSYLSVRQCLLNAIKPKTYVKKLYPEVENEWNCYGLPELIIVDNGKEFHSKDFEDACLQLGITVEYAPPGCPEYKGSKERYYETLNNQLLHNMPGTTFSDFLDKHDYDPLKNALIDVDTLKKIHHIYMIDIYARQIHKGIKDVPARRWKEGIAVFPPTHPPKGVDLRVLIGHIKYRVISRQGIELFGLFYNLDELAILRRETKGEKVKIKYDPTDISIIYVADAKHGLFIPVPAVDQEYTKGLSLFQHDVIRNYARKIAEEFVDSDALWRARKKIGEIVERAWDKSRKSSTRTKLARFKAIGLQDYWGGFEGEVGQSPEQFSTAPDQEGGQMRMNPEGAQAAEGISDVGISLDETDDSQSLPDMRDEPPVSNEAKSEPHLGITTHNRQRKSCRRDAYNDGETPKKADAAGTRLPTGTAGSNADEVDDVSRENTDDGKWEADYGQMDEEILKWQT